jgi:hypothetical protein
MVNRLTTGWNATVPQLIFQAAGESVGSKRHMNTPRRGVSLRRHLTFLTKRIVTSTLSMSAVMSEWINWKRVLVCLQRISDIANFCFVCLPVAVTLRGLKKSSTMHMKILRNNVLLTARSILVV